jgi:Protein of unknown function (DUF3072)
VSAPDRRVRGSTEEVSGVSPSFRLSWHLRGRLGGPDPGKHLPILGTTFPWPRRESTGMNTDGIPNPEKPTEQWVTGEEPMTGPQISYLQTLCREAGEEFDGTLTKAGASKKIEELQAKTGRGKT